MGTRGRKAPVELTVVPELPPEPPEHLSPGAAEAWRELFEVEGLKAGQLRGAMFLVENYCVSVSLARSFARDIERTPSGKLRDELARHFRATTTVINTLARSLRLTPRSRIQARVPLKAVPGRRPWELPVSDPPDAS